MVLASPETTRKDAEFDLDVRIDAVIRHGLTELGMKPTDQGCPDGPTNITCHPQGGCLD
jgi:hypothetical protein